MMYYYWTRHGIRPSTFYEMSPGELQLIRAFYQYDREHIEETLKKYQTGAFPIIDVLNVSR